jgi:DNA-binding XRE family transcriptional regulator
MEDNKLYSRVGLLRMERGWSRKELAERVGVNPQTIGYIERGEYNPSLALAFRFSEVFGLPIERIFSPVPFPPLS